MFLALIDDGSNSSILGSDAYNIINKFNLEVHSDRLFNVSAADGRSLNVVGYVYLPLTIGSQTLNLKVLVVPSLCHELILGIDALKMFGFTIDYLNSRYFLHESEKQDICTINTITSFENLSSYQKQSLENIINLFKGLSSKDKLGLTNLISHHIDTGTAKPFRQRQYPLSPAMQKFLNEEIDEMLSLGVIEPSQSPWSSPLWLVKKKDGEYRVCFDGRKLNEITVKDSYPLPLIDGILNKLRNAKYLSSIDLRKAFYQVPLEESSKQKTAFIVHGRGVFNFKVMPFGLSNSPQTMMRLMNQVIDPSLEPFAFCYLDDIIVATPDFQTHQDILMKIYYRLKNANLTINLDKCEFCRPSLTYLGFLVDQNGLRTNPEKVDSILNFPVPKTTTQIKRFIGLVSYYRRFIKNFSSTSSAITDLLKGRKKGQPITWTDDAEKAFIDIKNRLTTSPVLAAPDFNEPFVIQTDASDTGLGAVLYQRSDGVEHPVAYASRTLNKCERKYTVTEKECLGVIFGIERFRSYVEGTHFTVETDHASLIWLKNMSNPAGRLARWSLKLAQFDFTIVHRKGSTMVVADALSRSNSELAVLNSSSFKPCKWYQTLFDNIRTDPDKYPTFCIKDNIIYKHISHKNILLNNSYEWKIVVPTPNRTDVLKMYHDDPTAGHFGVSKTLSRILELYYWPKLRQDVIKYVKRCSICAASKSSNFPRAGLMGSYRNINFPFQMISADLLGPYPRSKNGNQYVLVIVDWFTKFVLVQPLAKATTKAVTKFIENQVFLIFGVPQIFCCDNGSQFISKDFKKLMEEYKVQKIFYNARYHAQVNHTERVNRVIVTALRSYIHENHKTWDTNIFEIAQAIRLAKHDVTEYSPAFLTFGRNIPVSGDYYGNISENDQNIPDISEKIHLANDLQQLPKVYEEVRTRLKSPHVKNTKYYNLRKRDFQFHVGDYVWKKNFQLSNAVNDFSAKLSPKFVPCIVDKVLSPLVYHLKDKHGNSLGNFHIKDLKPNFVTDDHSDLDSDDLSDDQSSN